MLQTLLESRARARTRPAQWTMASVIAHASVVGFAIVATGRAPYLAANDAPHDPVIYFHPAAPHAAPAPSRSAPAAPAAMVSRDLIAFEIPAIPRIEAVATATGERLGISEIAGAPGLPGGDPIAAPPDGVYSDRAVDRIVVPRGDNPSPLYPPQLRLASVEGDVVVRFVVDTAGRVEDASVAVLQSTHAPFATAVRQWLRRTRYAPAQIGGRPVRQLVEQRIGFTIR